MVEAPAVEPVEAQEVVLVAALEAALVVVPAAAQEAVLEAGQEAGPVMLVARRRFC